MAELKLVSAKEGKVLVKDGLLDGRSLVQIIDVSPEMCPIGYTPEYRIVQAARCSYGRGLTTPEKDRQLTQYLVRNRHTSPLEMTSVTFLLTIPKFVAIQLLRHRTAKMNEFSQRYAEIPESTAGTYYNPLEFKDGVRLAGGANKQGSVDGASAPVKMAAIKAKMAEANTLLDKLHELYHEMIDMGCATEVARYVLPIAEMTTMYYQLDLNNLSKMLSLRCDVHAQLETRVIANAMLELATPFFPIVLGHLQDSMKGFSLTGSELEILKAGTIPDTLTGSARIQLLEKAAKLGITLT